MIKRVVSFLVVSFVVFSITLPYSKAYADQEIPDESKMETQLQQSMDQFFIENKGQWDENILFIGKSGAFDIQICKDKIIYIPDVSNINTIELNFLEGSFADITPHEKMQTVYHYYIGNDPAKWGLNCQTYRKIEVKNVWSNIDLAYFFTDNQLKYEFYVHPGGDLKDIQVHVQGASLEKDGNAITMSNVSGIISDKDLQVFSQTDKQSLPIDFKLDQATNQISFQWEKKEQTIQDTIVIDPVIETSDYYFKTGKAVAFKFDPLDRTKKTYYIGSNYYDSGFENNFSGLLKTIKDNFNTGSGDKTSFYLVGSDEGDTILKSIETDLQGNVFLVGYTSSTDLPNHQNTFFGGEWDGFVAVIDSKSNLLTHYYGTPFNDSLNDIVTDPAGNIFVAGVKNGSEYPTNQIPSLSESTTLEQAPVPIYPHAEQVVNPGDNVYFQWWDVSKEYSYTGYWFELKREDDSIAYEGFVGNNYFHLQLNPGIEERLFWRVRNYYSSYKSCVGMISDWVPFTKLATEDYTLHLPEKPILLFPLNHHHAVEQTDYYYNDMGERIEGSFTYLNWSMDNLFSSYYYEIEIDNADNPGNPHQIFVGKDDPMGGVWFYHYLDILTLPFPLKPEMHFTWRLRVKNTVGWSEWSDYGNFTWSKTFSDPVKYDYSLSAPTHAPITVYPYPEQFINPSDMVVFLWSSFGAEDYYSFELKREDDSIAYEGLIGSNYFYLRLNPGIEERLFWRVRCENEFGVGPYSQWIPFTKRASAHLEWGIPPEKPILLYPSDNKQLSGDYFHFYWTPFIQDFNQLNYYAVTYSIEIEDIDNPGLVFSYFIDCIQLGYTFIINRNFLPFDYSTIKHFRWRVRNGNYWNENHYVWGEWSDYGYFQWNPFSEDSFLLRYNLDNYHLLLSNEIPISGNLRDIATSICLDTSFNRRTVGIAGFTTSTDLNTLGMTSQSKNNGSYDGFYYVYNFIDVLQPICEYSAYLGGLKDDFILNCTYDAYQQIYLVGTTFSDDFPIMGDYKDSTIGTFWNDGFLSVIDIQYDAFVFSSYFGGNYHDIVFDVGVYDQTIFLSGYSQYGEINTRPVVPSTPEECASPWDCKANKSGNNFFIKMMLKEEGIQYGFTDDIPYGAIHFDAKNNRALCIVNVNDLEAGGVSTTTLEFTTGSKVTFYMEGVRDKYGYGDPIYLRVVAKIEGCPVWVNGIDVELPDNGCISFISINSPQINGCIGEGLHQIDYTFRVNCDVDLQVSYPIRFILSTKESGKNQIYPATTSIVIAPKPKRGDNPNVGLVTRNLLIDEETGTKYLPYDQELAIDVRLSGFDFPINYEVRWGDGEIEKKEKVETEQFTLTHKYNIKGQVNVVIIITDAINRKAERNFPILIKD